MYYDRKLDNGIRVVGQYIPAFPSVSVGIWVRTGSVNEGRGENGITHFIEHMLFKGTQKRSAQQIAAEMDDVGGILNALSLIHISDWQMPIQDGNGVPGPWRLYGGIPGGSS